MNKPNVNDLILAALPALFIGLLVPGIILTSAAVRADGVIATSSRKRRGHPPIVIPGSDPGSTLRL